VSVILGLGLDLVDVARVEALVARHPARAAARLFTEGEWGYAATKARPALHLAARFAAKEAAYKALAGSAEARAIGWRDLEVVRGVDGAPALVLHGRAEARARVLGVRAIHLSLTHTADTAAAVVILES
jgi:holo-[acyl-carrier protein] synthase